MALYNEILVGRFNKLATKVFGMKGQAPSPQISSEITLSHPLFHGRENRFLESWESFVASTTVAATAAQNTVIRIVNPAGSNMVFVIERLQYGALTVATQLLVRFFSNGLTTQPDLVTLATAVSMDSRTQRAATLRLSGQTTAAPANIGQPMMRQQVALNGIMEVVWTDINEIVMAQGSAIDLVDQTQNDGVTCNLMWRERFLEESERF